MAPEHRTPNELLPEGGVATAPAELLDRNRSAHAALTGRVALASALFTLSLRPLLASQLDRYHAANALLLTLAAALLLFAVRRTRRVPPSLVERCTIAAVVLLLAGAAIHVAVVRQLGPDEFVNVAGVTTEAWRAEIVKFTVLYLFFPVLLLLHMRWLPGVPPAPLVHGLALAMAPSVAVIAYQRLVDPTFLLEPFWIALGRMGGLATDPNAFAMSAFLMLPPLGALATVERRRGTAAAYAAFTVALLLGIWFSGSRTAAGGVVLLVASVPAIAAAADRTRPRRTRIAMAAAPVLLLICVRLAAPAVLESRVVRDTGPLARRLHADWERYRKGGIADVLFKSEQRGGRYLAALELIRLSPLAGWGPGGYYCEYPNQRFREGKPAAVAGDSALNHYLMIGGDFGLPALALNLLVLLAPLAAGCAALRRSDDPAARLLLAALVAGNAIFLLMIVTIPPLYFPDVVWPWTAQLAFLATAGGPAARTASRPRTRLAWIAAVGLLAAATAAGAAATARGPLGYRARQAAKWWPIHGGHDRSLGFYGVEGSRDARYRWTGRRALVSLPWSANTLVMELANGHPLGTQRPARVRVLFAGRDLGEIEVPGGFGEHRFFVGRPTGEQVIVELQVPSAFRPTDDFPAHGLGPSADGRALGVMVRAHSPRFEAKVKGIATGPQVVVGAGPGAANLPEVRGFDAVGRPNGETRFLAYGAGGFGVNVALGNLETPTPAEEILTAPGPGEIYGPQVRAFHRSGEPLPKVSFYAFGTLRYGARVASGDLDADRRAEILTGPGPASLFAPHVRAFDYDGVGLSPLRRVSIYASASLRYGALPAAANLDRDRYAEILVAPGPSGVSGAHVRGFDYDGWQIEPIAGIDFSPYASSHGVHVATGNLDGDDPEELLTAPGPDPMATSRVRAFDYDGPALAPLRAVEFDAIPGPNRYGATLDGHNLDHVPTSEIVVGTGYDPGNGGPRVRGWQLEGGAAVPRRSLIFDAFSPAQRYGVNVVAGKLSP